MKIKREKDIKNIEPCLEYSNAINYVKTAVGGVNSISEKLDIINYVLDIIKTDLQSDLLSAMFYKGWNLKRIGYPFPFMCYDKEGKEIIIYNSEIENIDVDIQKQCIIALPWKNTRYTSAIINMKKLDFKFMSDNHMSVYFSHVDLCYTFNGVHSISASLGYKKAGVIQARLLHTEMLFEHVYTNGQYWINIHTDEPLKKVWDFRTAIIYELSKMKYNFAT